MNPRAMSLWISAGRVLRDGAARNRPGAVLIFTDGEEGNVAEEVVAGANDAAEAGFAEAQIGQKGLCVGGIERRDLEFDLGAHGNRRGRRAREKGGQPCACRGLDAGAADDVRLVEVDHDEQRLGRQQLKAA